MEDEEELLAVRRADEAVTWLRRATAVDAALVLCVALRAWFSDHRRWYAPDAGPIANAFIGFFGALGDGLRHVFFVFGIWSVSMGIALLVTVGVARGNRGFERDRVYRHVGALWAATCGIPAFYVVFGGLLETF